MEKEINYFKIGFFILLIVIIILSIFFISKFYISESYIEGYNQGRNDIIFLNSNGRFLLYNTRLNTITNTTQEFTIGNICSYLNRGIDTKKV